MFRVVALALAIVGVTALAALAESPAETALALVSRYHEDPTRIDRARDLLETALKTERRVETMAELSHVYLLVGDVRATSRDEKLAAYERGRELGQRAIELAPRSEEAHFWYLANTGRFGQTKGVMRSLFLLPTVREEIDILLTLNPRSARTHAVAGSVSFEVPGIAGGDRAKAEEHYKKALELDPHYTLARLDLARLLIATDRYAEARRQLQRVVAETSPTNLADWTVRDVLRARQLLESIKDRK